VSSDARGAGGITPGKAAAFAERAKRLNLLIQQARYFLATGTGDAGPLLMEAQELSAAHRSELAAAAGLHAAPPSPSASAAVAVPLHLLDTPAARDLLAILEEAQQIAEQVDAERGRTVGEDIPLLPGESRGTDLAEAISQLALRVRTEVHGPKGRE